ncbi:MAG: hypothetical protein LBF58_10455 [Deltaproteobacteria bacterium]|jgi:hypothetical protein|nr:hypothetical protein [Deltaproteobacteria bacterium]
MKIFVGTLDMHGKPCFDAGDVFEGETHLMMLAMMIDPPFFTMNTEKDPDRFIDQTLEQIKKFSGMDLRATGETTAVRAESFFKVLVENKLACYVN